MSYTLDDGKGLDTGLHPDLVAEVADMLEHWGVDLGAHGRDAVARALLQGEAWKRREESRDAEHARRRDSEIRRAEIAQRVYLHKGGTL